MTAREASSSASFSSGERWGTVGEVAALLGFERSFVYDHAAELGGRKIGSGPKAPWRFRLEDVLAATSCHTGRESGVQEERPERLNDAVSGDAVKTPAPSHVVSVPEWVPIRAVRRG